MKTKTHKFLATFYKCGVKVENKTNIISLCEKSYYNDSLFNDSYFLFCDAINLVLRANKDFNFKKKYQCGDKTILVDDYITTCLIEKL